MFSEQYRRDNEKLHAKETLLMEIKRQQEQETKQAAKRARFTRYAVAAAVAVVVFAGAISLLANRPKVDTQLNGVSAAAATAETFDTAALPAEQPEAAMLEAIAETVEGEANVLSDGGASAETPASDGAKSPADYDELFALMESMNAGVAKRALYGAAEPAAETATAGAGQSTDAAPAAAPAAEAAASDGGAACPADFSETNVQVAGIDEADVVKTDGKHIYYVANNQLVILSAQGKDTGILSATMLESNDKWWGYSSEMFLRGDRLLLITSGTSVVWVKDGAGYNDNRDMTQVRLYDISNPEKPKLLTTLGQSGSYVSSRMVGDFVYLVTTQFVYNPVRSMPGTFVPVLQKDGAEQTVAAGDIYYYDNPQSLAYTVIGAIDIASGRDFASAKAVFGGTGELYVNGEHLLLAGSEYHEEIGEIAPDANGRNVQVTSSHSNTRLTLFTLDGASIRYTAGTIVPGTLVNQFAMDEYKGVFRIVTSVNEWTQRIYTDGVDSYEYEDSNSNALFTLDGALNPLGSIEDIAPDEWVESVRFNGDIGYFVTFRQVDPLFAVDLSNPAKPAILSALKIPGFSEYLHVYGDGLLFGLGYAADENTGRTQGVKLSMFDTSNKRDVKELSTEVLPAQWTVVGSNHHAILVDPAKNLIAFPADSAYYIYAYDAEKGFTELAKVSMSEDLYSWNLRGLFVGDSFYVLSESSVTVISLNTWETVKTLTISYG